MNKAWKTIAALALAGLAPACKAPLAEAPLAGAGIGGPFVLTDQDGRPFDSKALLGRYAIVYFGYTFCPDVCPTDMQVLGQGLKQFGQADADRAAKVQPVFVTVDPERDTPAVLKQFVRAFSPVMVGLTGTADQIAKVAKDYAIFYRRQPPVKGAPGYMVDHSRQAVLFGPDGKPIALVPVDADPQQVADMLGKWVR